MDEVNRVVRMRLNSGDHLHPPASLERLSPDAVEVYEEILEQLGFARVATANKEDKQLIVEGQVLVLGDAREGKTSLVKALTGKKHDPEQAKTHGVESQVVNRKWQEIEGERLIFGDFNRFSKTELTESAFLPRIFNKDIYQYGRNTSEDPNKLYTVVYNYLFGWFFYLRSFLPGCLQDDENEEEESRFFIGFVLLLFLVKPVVAMLFGLYWARFLLLCFFFVIETMKMVAVKGVKENFFMFWGMFLGLEIAAWHNCGFRFVPNILPYLNNMQAVCTKRPGPGCLLFINFFTGIIGSCCILVLMIVAQLLVDVCFYIGNSLSSSLASKLPFASNRLKLVFDILLDVQGSLYTMLELSFIAPIMNLLSPLPGVVPYSYSSIYFSFMIFCLHIINLYQQGQNVLLASDSCITALAVVELGMLFYYTTLPKGNDISVLVLVIVMFVLQFTTHCYGRWCEIERLFEGKSFSDIVFRNDFTTTALIVEKATINKRKLKKALRKQFCSLKLKLVDFAGDKDYYYYHHIFLKTHAIYVIVFNLKSFVDDNFKDIKRNMERLRFWFESVCAHVPETTPIFLVGTHSGTTKDDVLKILNYHLREELWPDFCDHLIINDQDDQIYFHVENINGTSDEGVQLLRRKIHDIAEKECTDNKVPLSWIKVQDYILTLQNKPSNLCCVTVEDFKEKVDHLCNLWSLEMLDYFHEKGLIIYLKKDEELSKWILLNPGLIVDIIVQLVNPSCEVTQERGYRQCWRMLTESGMLAKGLLHRILAKFGDNCDVMKKYLKGYDLICPLEHEAFQQSDNGQQTYITTGCSRSVQLATHFIPSLLPESISLKPIWHPKSDDEKFFVSFESFPPEPLFHRLLSRAHKQSKASCSRPNPVVRRDDGLFWLTPQQPYRIKLLKEEGLIEVTVCRSTRGETKQSDVLSQVWYMVNSIQRRDFQFAKFHCGPECPSLQCPGEQFGMNAVICGLQFRSRRHIFNVLPACQDGSHHVSFCCLNESFEPQLKKWVPNASGR